jgi:3-oxoacyl-[acyl-carrier-protein] synthase III
MIAARLEGLTRRLLDRVNLVCRDLGRPAPVTADPQTRFADLLDSMGLVEFLLIVARDYGTTPEAIEECVGREFGTVAELAADMVVAGLAGPAAAPRKSSVDPTPAAAGAVTSARHRPCWLGATAVRLPEAVQPASTINALLERPPGWLERHAGITGRRSWQGQDALAAAADAGQECLQRSGVVMEKVGALLATSEAPPLLAGLAAALHHRLGLRPTSPALEIGGACTGFLAALWLARRLLPSTGAILIVSVEAPTQHLPLRPGAAGEAAALFGDAAAACLVSDQPLGQDFVSVAEILFGVEGAAGPLIQIEHAPGQGVDLRLDGQPLARRAVRTMAQVVRDLARDKGVALGDLAAVVAHGGNGRMPALLARQLQLPPERVWSETARLGNLGSASLPVAWAAHEVIANAPVAWTAVGAGLTWGAALTGPCSA